MPIGPSTHYLICLTVGGGALLITIDNRKVNFEMISNDSGSSIVGMGRLTDDAFYLLNKQQEMLFFLLDPDLLELGSYTVSSNNIRVVNHTGNIRCTDIRTTKQGEHGNVLTIIIPSVLGNVILIIIIILILLYCRRKRYIMYRMPDAGNMEWVDPTVEPHSDQPDVQISDELSDDKKADHPIEASPTNGTDQMCIPVPSTDADVCSLSNKRDQTNSAPSDLYPTTCSPRQCTNNDSEPSLPTEYRQPPDGGQT